MPPSPLPPPLPVPPPPLPASPGAEPLFSVCELFASIQGEATWSGRPMVFVRFWGCPLACPWCDEPLHRRAGAVRVLTLSRLLEALEGVTPDLRAALLTGGEPLAQPGLGELVGSLKSRGWWVAMESSGVGGGIPQGLDWLTLSPKTPLPEPLLAGAQELKYLLGADPPAEEVAAILAVARRHPAVWVQPLARGGEPDPAATATCYRLVMASGGRLRLSTQLHKYLKVP